MCQESALGASTECVTPYRHHLQAALVFSPPFTYNENHTLIGNPAQTTRIPDWQFFLP